MGDGKNLKRIIAEKGTNIRQLAFATGICPTTLYSIVSKDSEIRLDFAVLIAEELGIKVEEICHYHGYPIPENFKRNNIGLEAYRQMVLRYYGNIIGPMIELYGLDRMWEVDELLRYFYQLDDIARKDTIKMVRGMLEYHTDPERKMELMAFKKRSYRWKEIKGGL